MKIDVELPKWSINISEEDYQDACSQVIAAAIPAGFLYEKHTVRQVAIATIQCFARNPKGDGHAPEQS